jgi:DNA-binding XRE family transcriptional regulator
MRTTKYDDLDDFFRRSGRTHEWLAQRIGVDRSYISLIRSRRRQPSLPIAVAIKKETGVPVEALVGAVA